MKSEIAYMPNQRPAPTVLTQEEAYKFLRIGDYPNPGLTLRHYREQKKLRATRIGRRLFYTSSELLAFLERMTGDKNVNR